jgi:hypothetical protein
MVSFLRKCFRIKATDSPNVRAGEMLRRQQPGLPLEEVDRRAYAVGMPGLIGWLEWKQRLRTFDPHQACVSLDADWYEGAEVKLFPTPWLQRAAATARALPGQRRAKALCCDSGEGRADTCWVVGDEQGILELIAKKTVDTTEVVSFTLGLMQQYGLAPENVMFDAGGGGRQHADRIRSQGFDVRVVGFGEMVSIVEPVRRGQARPFKEKVERREDKQFLLNRRAEMYWDFALTNIEPDSYGIPSQYTELYRQLSLMPRKYDEEGKFYLPKKGDPTTSAEERRASGKLTLIDIIGCSPDHADAVVVMYHCMTHPKKIMRAGALTK